MATRQRWDSETERMTKTLDSLTEYDKFCELILTKLKRLVKEKWSSKRIEKELGPYLTARVVSQGLTGSLDKAATIRACQDVLDRSEGKPVKKEAVTLS
jgi:hypothetical protein